MKSAPVPSTQADNSLSAIYRAHHAFVWRSAHRLGVPAAVVDDVVQDVFVVLHRRFAEFDLTGSHRALLFGITRRVAKRYRPRARPRLRVVHGPAEPVVDGGVARWEAADQVRQFLAELDEPKREAFILSELEGMAAPEIAVALGDIPVNTVYTRLRAARLKFRKVVARHQAKERRHRGAR